MGILLDGPLGEHIRFPFQPPVIVQHFQRAKQIISGIPIKCQPVGTVIDKTELRRKGIIKPAQLGLLLLDSAVRGIFVLLMVIELCL